MSESPVPLYPLSELASLNPESLPSATPGRLRFRYIDLSSVSHGSINWKAVREEQFASAPSRARRVVRKGDTLFGTVRPEQQSHASIPFDLPGSLVASTGFTVIRPTAETEARYLHHVVLGREVLRQARRAELGSNYPAVNESDVGRFLIRGFPLAEQRRIAEILDTMDEAIRRTEEVIAKLQQVKQGLLHDLLTRGIDDNGELRDPDRHPENFHETPLGLLPAAWSVTRLGALFEVGAGANPAAARHSEGRYRLMGANGPLGRAKRSNFGPGYIVGRVGAAGFINRVDEAVWASDNTLTCLPVADVTDFDAGEWLLRVASPESLVSKTAQPLVTQTGLAGLAVPKVPLDEQRRLASVMASAENRLEAERSGLAKLRLLKSGLMDDLLTGRVRVKLPAEEAEA